MRRTRTPSDRWITVYSGIEQRKSFKDPLFNYVGIADLSDSALLTTLARVMHFPWNPTEKYAPEELMHDSFEMHAALLKVSFNILHIFHYNAMSLDHHIYFHSDDYTKTVRCLCRDCVDLHLPSKTVIQSPFASEGSFIQQRR